MYTVDEIIEKYYERPANFARSWGIHAQDVAKWRKAGFMFREIVRDGNLTIERYSKRGEVNLTEDISKKHLHVS